MICLDMFDEIECLDYTKTVAGAKHVIDGGFFSWDQSCPLRQRLLMHLSLCLNLNGIGKPKQVVLIQEISHLHH